MLLHNIFVAALYSLHLAVTWAYKVTLLLLNCKISKGQ